MVRLSNITKYYPTRKGPRLILDQVSFSLRKGQKLGILGCNGAGKSTLIRLVGGVELPNSGSIERYMSVSWPLGFLGGFAGGMTALDNLRFICRLYNVAFDEALQQVEDFSELGMYLREPVATYSSGMRARLAFAISMAVNFDCYLIDEISAVGDRRFNEKCKRELFNIQNNKSLIMVSHFYGIINEYCNSVAVLDRGRLTMFNDSKEATKYYDEVLKSKDITF
jgi:capsular polysaccharide transport system ATP-binding protein